MCFPKQSGPLNVVKYSERQKVGYGVDTDSNGLSR